MVEATGCGMRHESLTSYPRVSEFDRLRDVLARAKDEGFEVTMDGQVKGYDYIHTPKRECYTLSSCGIEQKLELIKAGRLRSLELPVLTRREEPIEEIVFRPNTFKQKVASAVLFGGATAGLIYMLSSYLQ